MQIWLVVICLLGTTLAVIFVFSLFVLWELPVCVATFCLCVIIYVFFVCIGCYVGLLCAGSCQFGQQLFGYPCKEGNYVQVASNFLLSGKAAQYLICKQCGQIVGLGIALLHLFTLLAFCVVICKPLSKVKHTQLCFARLT